MGKDSVKPLFVGALLPTADRSQQCGSEGWCPEGDMLEVALSLCSKVHLPQKVQTCGVSHTTYMHLQLRSPPMPGPQAKYI